MFKRTWTDAELETLKNQQVPATRSINGARWKAQQLGIPFHPNKRDLGPCQMELPKAKPDRGWTEDEISLLYKKQVPPGRTKAGALGKAYALKIPFNIVRKAKVPQKELVAKLKDQIIQELKDTNKIRATARKFGVNFTAVRNVALEIGIIKKEKTNA